MRVAFFVGLVFCSFGVGQCDLGLNVGVPGFVQSVAKAVGNPIIPLTKANATIRVDVKDDESDTLINLIKVSNNVTFPMNKMLGYVLRMPTMKNMSTCDVFNNVSKLIMETELSIKALDSTVQQIENKTKSGNYEALYSNYSNIAESLGELLSNVSHLYEIVKLIETEEYPVTVENVTNFINSTVQSNFTSPLRSISSSILKVADLIRVIATERIQSVTFLKEIKTVTRNNRNSIEAHSAAYNKSVTDTLERISNIRINTFKSINETYKSILSKSADYNGGVMTNLTQFLQDMQTANASFSQFVEFGTNYSKEQVNQTLEQQLNLTSTVLLNVATNISNEAATNSSQFVGPCLQRARQHLLTPPLSLDRLSTCMAQEANSYQTSIIFVQNQMEVARLAAVSIATQMAKVCHKTNGKCAGAFFGAFPEHSVWVQDKVSAVSGGVADDSYVIMSKIQNCIMGTAGELEDNILDVENRFNSCLASGTF
ncbi:uncharacterized protein LOC129741347 [Uranotaenia lowii]|uniref:uncharacterized protein LOC129741347 n=1 Tax=Uranotaenia lowii TaxID=190385 RepID=UPI0024789E08|nr:uncharacterized protein LOC129741347 [Uranotaenia lowii]